MKLRLTSYELGMACRNYSTLAIRDGQNPSSALLKSFCTRQYESSFFSSGRYLWVRFQSPKQDWSDNFWFTAEFEAVTQCKTFSGVPDFFPSSFDSLQCMLKPGFLQ